MDTVWAKVLRKLREGDEHALFSLVSNLSNIEFTGDTIIITAISNAEYRVLTKNRAKLNRMAGGDYIVIEMSNQNKTTNENLAALQEMFGERLRK